MYHIGAKILAVNASVLHTTLVLFVVLFVSAYCCIKKVDCIM